MRKKLVFIFLSEEFERIGESIKRLVVKEGGKIIGYSIGDTRHGVAYGAQAIVTNQITKNQLNLPELETIWFVGEKEKTNEIKKIVSETHGWVEVRNFLTT